MKNKVASIGSRHPAIVLIQDNEEDLTGTIGILTQHAKDFRAIPFNSDTSSFLEVHRPQVILFGLSSVDSCIEYYSSLIEENKLQYLHQAILLCKNKESGIAFKCCLKGLFDNYFVYQPLYEKFRLLMIIQNAISHTHSTAVIFSYYDEKFEEINEELESLIDESSQCKQNLLERIEERRQEVSSISDHMNTISDKASEVEDSDKIALFASIADQHVKSLLNNLEDDIHQSIDSLIKQLLTQKDSVASLTNSEDQFYKQIPPNSLQVNDEQNENLQANNEDLNSNGGNQKSPGLLSEYGHTPPLKKNKIKILVVEDNAIYRKMLVGVLQKAAFDVHDAEDGILALKMIKKEHFDLIMMDLYMPKLDGLNTTKKIREFSGGKDIPVIALTGNKNKEYVRKWLNYGLKGYIIKPSSTEAILNAVNGALKI